MLIFEQQTQFLKNYGIMTITFPTKVRIFLSCNKSYFAHQPDLWQFYPDLSLILDSIPRSFTIAL